MRGSRPEPPWPSPFRNSFPSAGSQNLTSLSSPPVDEDVPLRPEGDGVDDRVRVGLVHRLELGSTFATSQILTRGVGRGRCRPSGRVEAPGRRIDLAAVAAQCLRGTDGEAWPELDRLVIGAEQQGVVGQDEHAGDRAARRGRWPDARPWSGRDWPGRSTEPSPSARPTNRVLPSRLTEIAVGGVGKDA